MSFETQDAFKPFFTFSTPTTSIKFSDSEYQSFLNEALSRYDNPTLRYNKVQLTSNSLNHFSLGVIDLHKQGFSITEDARGLSGNGSFGLFFVKPLKLQEEDREYIELMIKQSYTAAIEANGKAVLDKLKNDLLQEEKVKEQEKANAQRAKKDAEAQKKAIEQYEQMLRDLEGEE